MAARLAPTKTMSQGTDHETHIILSLSFPGPYEGDHWALSSSLDPKGLDKPGPVVK